MWKKVLLALLAVSVLSGLVWRLASTKDLPTKIRRIDELLLAYHKLNKFNGTVLVSQNGRILLEKGYGFQDFESQIPNTPQTLYRIYSVTKPITSTVVLKLVEDKKLSLTDPLSKFYPDLPHANEITIEHLLTHTSGIFDYTREESYTVNNEANLLKLLADKPLDFPVGKGWQYSNSNYCLLGHLIAKVSRSTYEAVVRDKIFEPANMQNSGFDFEDLKSPHKATGYEFINDSSKQPAEVIPSSGPFAAGAIYSSAGDLFRFQQALVNHKLVSQSSLNKAWSPSATSSNYGRGWQLGYRFFRKKVLSHGGGAPGFRSNLSFIPNDDICVVVLCNHENTNAKFLTDMIYDVLYDYRVTTPTETPQPVSDIEHLVGIFLIPGAQPQNLVTSIVDDRLAIGPFGQPACTLLARNSSTFSQPEAGAVLQFSKDASGEWNKLTIGQTWGKLSAVRVNASWGIVGDATPNGWESKEDLPMHPITNKPGQWEARHVELKTGEIKFRFNNDWPVNYGDKDRDGMLEPFGGNIPIQGGNYDIVLDLSKPSKPTYTVTKVLQSVPPPE